MSPTQAATDAIIRILKYYEHFVGAILAVDKFGNHGKKKLVFFIITFRLTMWKKVPHAME